MAHPPDRLATVVEHAAPAWIGRLGAQTNKTQPGLGEDGEAERYRRAYDHDRQHVRDDVERDDARRAGPDRAGRLDELLPSNRQHRASDLASEPRDVHDADRDH